MLSFVKSLKEKIAKTKNSFIGKIAETLSIRGKVDEELLEELEEVLLQADLGGELAMNIIDQLRDEIRVRKITDTTEVQSTLQKIISDILIKDYENIEPGIQTSSAKPYVVLVIGVNGNGKTTTIGKLAKKLKDEGKSVLLVAADTFRAAAIEQLTIWAERANVPLIKQLSGADPSSVVYDGVAAAVNKNVDVVLIDTAGRQHTKVNLMNELSKINRTIQKIIPEGAHETLLIIDSTTGQNGISQAKLFNEVTKLTGLVLTKFDGTAKGGIAISIKHQLNIPVKYIGIGEGIDDLRVFDAEEFVTALFE